MRERLSEWLAEFAAPRSSHSQRVQALVGPRRDAAPGRALAPALGGLHEQGARRRTRGRDPHLPRLVLAAAACRADGAARPARPASRHGADRGRRGPSSPAVLRAFHAAVLATRRLRADYAALAARRGRSAGAPMARGGLVTGASRSSSPMRRDARDERAGARPSWPEIGGARASGARARAAPPGDARCGAWPRGARPGGVRAPGRRDRARAALDSGRCRPASSKQPGAALFTARARRAGSSARRPRGSPRCRPTSSGCDQQRACARRQLEHLRMVRLARVLLAAYAALTSAPAASPTWPTSERCALALLRDGDAVRLGAGAARRAHPPRADRRIPGHESAAMACACTPGWRATPAPAAARAGSGRPASSSSATRSRASTASAAPSRASSRRRASSSRDGARRQRARLRPHAAQRARGARRRQRGVRAARERRRVRWLSPHTTEVAAARGAAVVALPRHRATAARGEPLGTPTAGLARHPDDAAPRARRACCASAKRDAVALAIADAGRRRGRGARASIMVLCRKREIAAPASAKALRPLHIAYAAVEDFALLGVARGARPDRRARRAGVAAPQRCRSRMRCAARCSAPATTTWSRSRRRAAPRARLVAALQAHRRRASRRAASAQRLLQRWRAGGGAPAAARPARPHRRRRRCARACRRRACRRSGAARRWPTSMRCSARRWRSTAGATRRPTASCAR